MHSLFIVAFLLVSLYLYSQLKSWQKQKVSRG